MYFHTTYIEICRDTLSGFGVSFCAGKLAALARLMNIISCVHIGLVMSVFAHVKRTGGGDGGESLLLGEGARGDFFFFGAGKWGSPFFEQSLN